MKLFTLGTVLTAPIFAVLSSEVILVGTVMEFDVSYWKVKSHVSYGT